MTRNVLVTGGSGFIGTWVVRNLLHEDCNVIVYDAVEDKDRWKSLIGSRLDRITFIAGDLFNQERLTDVFNTWAIDTIIHLAAWLTPACQSDPYKGCETNVLGAMRLFELARTAQHRVRGFAYASSIAVYGPEWGQPNVAQDSISPSTPLTFYGAFKKAVELIAMQYWLHYGIASVGLRPVVIYGPGREVGSTAGITLAARAVAKKERYTIPFTGATAFDFVEDTARGFVRSALDIDSGCYVVDMPGVSVSVDEIIDCLDKIRPGSRKFLAAEGPALPYPVRPDEFCIDRLFPDWKTVGLEEGLRRVVTYYEEAPASSGASV